MFKGTTTINVFIRETETETERQRDRQRETDKENGKGKGKREVDLCLITNMIRSNENWNIYMTLRLRNPCRRYARNDNIQRQWLTTTKCCFLDMTGLLSHELTMAVTTCTRAVQDQANPSKDEDRGSPNPNLI